MSPESGIPDAARTVLQRNDFPLSPFLVSE
jgi:hypothetical protein